APRFAGGYRFDSATWLRQTRKDFLCAVENFPWQTGQTRDVDSVAFVRAAGDDFAQENDLLVPFAHRDIEIADAATVLGEFGQLVVVRREQRPRFDFVVQKLGHTPGNGEPVESRRAAADLIQNHQAAFGGVIHDI